MPGAGLTGTRLGKAPSERPALEPYRGKPAVRNLRGDNGDVGIIRSPVRAIVLPDSSLTAGGFMRRRPALGRRGAEADDVRTGEVTLTGSTDEVGEQNGLARGGVDGGKRWDREECGTAKHGPDSVPAKLCPKRTPSYEWPLPAAKRHLLAIRAVCGNSARTDLCGGCPVMGIPTALSHDYLRERQGNSQGAFLPSSSALRFANGEWVAMLWAPVVLLPPPLASSYRWCSLSWQYRHSSCCHPAGCRRDCGPGDGPSAREG